jgi:membrane-associated phospholipid phosphatase
MSELILKVIAAHPIPCFVMLLGVILFSIALLWHLVGRGFPPIMTGLLRLVRRTQKSPYKHLDLREKTLGVYVTLGALVGFVALSVFCWIAGEVMNREAIVRFDHVLTETIRQSAAPWEIQIFRFVTTFGSFYVLAPMIIGIGVMLLLLRRRVSLVGWIVAVLGGVIANVELKSVFERPRPEPLPPFIDNLTSWSFPSGHAMDSLIIYGMLTYLSIPLTKGRWRKALVLTSVGVVLSIGFSRLYLGVHYFSDIIAGYAAGIFWLNLCIVGTEILRHARSSKSLEDCEMPRSEEESGS